MPERSQPPNIEAEMLKGSRAFLGVAVGVLLVGIIPFFVVPNHWLLRSLAMGLGAGALLQSLLTAFAWKRKAPLALLAGFAGSLAYATFLYLRIGQIIIAASAKQCPEPDYPAAFQNILPLAYLLAFGAILAYLGNRRQEP